MSFIWGPGLLAAAMFVFLGCKPERKLGPTEARCLWRFRSWVPVFMAYPPWLRVGLPSWWYVATTEGVALQQLGRWTWRTPGFEGKRQENMKSYPILWTWSWCWRFFSSTIESRSIYFGFSWLNWFLNRLMTFLFAGMTFCSQRRFSKVFKDIQGVAKKT